MDIPNKRIARQQTKAQVPKKTEPTNNKLIKHHILCHNRHKLRCKLL